MARKSGRFFRSRPIAKSRVLLIVVSVRRARSSLEVLLDLGGFVADMQRGDDPLSNDAGIEHTRRAFGNPPLEDQADLGRATQIDVLANDLLEQVASAQGSVEDLRAGEFRLQDGQLGVEAGGVILRGEGIGQA